jgi:hypothetical protein
MFNDYRVRFALVGALGVLLLLLTNGRAMTSGAAASNEEAVPSCERIADFDPNNFSDPTNIDNEWSPMVPGTQMVLTGIADDVPHSVVSTVTGLTKVINGVRAVVISETDLSEGEVVESELAFKAQDDDGNVWNLGEYPEEYEDGEFVGAPSTWIAGVGDAEAGLLMQADPQVGTGYYLQGSVPSIDFLDCAKVFATGEQVCVPFSCYEDVLVTDERAPLEPSEGHQRKFYASGVGNIAIGATGSSGEFLELVDIVQLSSGGLARADREALKMEKRAYRVSEVYGETPPAK